VSRNTNTPGRLISIGIPQALVNRLAVLRAEFSYPDSYTPLWGSRRMRVFASNPGSVERSASFKAAGAASDKSISGSCL
jgi:hypothetical protein